MALDEVYLEHSSHLSCLVCPPGAPAPGQPRPILVRWSSHWLATLLRGVRGGGGGGGCITGCLHAQNYRTFCEQCLEPSMCAS